MKKEEKNSSRTWNHGAGRIVVNHVETFFTQKPEKLKENHTVATLWKLILSGLNRSFFFFCFFFFFFLRELFFIIRDKNLSRQTKLKIHLAQQRLIDFIEHKRPISSEDREVLRPLKNVLQMS